MLNGLKRGSFCLLLALLVVVLHGVVLCEEHVHVSDAEASGLKCLLDNCAREDSIFFRSFAHLDYDEKEELVATWKKLFDSWEAVSAFLERNVHFLYDRDRASAEDEEFLSLFESFLDLVEVSLVVNDLRERNPHAARFLNEGDAIRKINSGTVTAVSSFITDDKNIRGILSGIVGLRATQRRLLPDTPLSLHSRELISRGEKLLLKVSRYAGLDPLVTVESVIKELRHVSEKGISILATGRDFSGRSKFISEEDVQAFRHLLQPGDVLLRRNNWQLTNIGIPGFWTHSGMYLGTLDELEDYFGELFEETGTTVIGFLDDHTEGAVSGLSNNAEPGANCIIEGIAAGVVIRPLENIAVTDYFAVLRPLVPREDKLEAIIRAFQYLGRPYDYAFDFATDMEMICSEVILKAYLPGGGISGLAIHPYEHRGKLMFSPNDFARVYAEERATENAQLELVLFIDASEIDQTSFEGDEEGFSSSWTRSRYDLMRIRKPEH